MGREQPFILWVDDTAESFFSQMWCLQNAGCRVVPLSRTEEAFSFIKEQQPDLALLDIVMPGPGGLELCRQLQACPATADIPVIMLTLQDSRKLMDKAFAAGAVDYLLKPVDPAVIVPAVDIRLHTHALWQEVRLGHYGAQADAQVSTLLSYLYNRLHSQGTCPIAQNYRRDNIYEALATGGVSTERVAHALADFFKLPVLRRIDAPLRRGLLTSEFCRARCAYPFMQEGTPAFAICNPLDREMLSRVRRLCPGGPVRLFVATPELLSAALCK